MKFVIPLFAAARSMASGREIVAAFAGIIAIFLAGIVFNETPKPCCADEFAYLFSAECMAEGRLSLPPREDAKFFQTFYVLESPVRIGRFPPAQSCFLALGILLGHPILGVVISLSSGMTVTYALLRLFIRRIFAVIAISLASIALCASYWANSYWGGGAAFLGGALTFYSFLGMFLYRHKKCRLGSLYLCGIAGILLLSLSRPTEGLLFTGALTLISARHKRHKGFLTIALIGGSVSVIANIAYNAATMGSPLRFPYLEYEFNWCKYPIFIWQAASVAELLPVGIPILDTGRIALLESKSFLATLAEMPLRFGALIAYTLGLAAAPVIIMGWFRSLMSRAFRWIWPLWASLALLFIGLRASHAHYAAPWLPALLIFGVLALLRILKKQLIIPAYLLLAALWFSFGGAVTYPIPNAMPILMARVHEACGLAPKVIVFVDAPDSPSVASNIFLYNLPDQNNAPWFMVNLLDRGSCDAFCAKHPDRKAFIIKFLRTNEGLSATLFPYASQAGALCRAPNTPARH